MATNPRGIPYPEASNGLPYMPGSDPVHEIDEWTKALAESIDPVALGAAPSSHTHTPAQVGLSSWGPMAIAMGTINIAPDNATTVSLPAGRFGSSPMVFTNVRSAAGPTSYYTSRTYSASTNSFTLLLKNLTSGTSTYAAQIDWLAIGPKA